MQLDFFNDLSPSPGTLGYGTRLRALRTEYTDKWQQRRDEVQADPTAALTEIESAEAEGRLEELLVVAGQSAGLVTEILPAAEIVRRIASEAEKVLIDAARPVS